MNAPRPAQQTRTDFESLVGSLASRLRLHGHAMRGLAARAGNGPDSVEGRTHRELADDLDTIADRLDILRRRLCDHCRLLEIVEDISISE